MKSKIKKILDAELKKYRTKEIKLDNRQYKLYIFQENPRANLYEGIMCILTSDKSEIKKLKQLDPYKSGMAYCPRLLLILDEEKDTLLIKDNLYNKQILKTLNKVNETFIKKLKKAFSKATEENFNKLFDRTDVIEEFYVLFKKAREFMLKDITGISEEEEREEFVDNFMMQMLTLWYLQERGFFNNDLNYFVTKFKELKQKKLFGEEFKNYYEFLQYFFEKISNNIGEQYYKDDKVGKVVVVGPAVFINGEQKKAISIPDKCFYKDDFTYVLINTRPKKVGDEVPLLNLFESRDWTEGNIDEFVLGAIYEKLITYHERKRTGAYYTPEEITSYICKSTIEPYLVDRMSEKFSKEFKSIDQIIESDDKNIIVGLFEELKEIKILDPAVGSGHFLESAINVLLRIYEMVWEKAKNLDVKKGLTILTSNEKGEIEKIELSDIKDEEKFKLFVKFFIILSKNIYGVDINPSALKVARARLFLTLAKHFKVGKEKDIFIRFPNVHFNLRMGNSLIGYIDFKKEEQKKQITLFDLMKEEQTQYIAEKIKVLSELKEYLKKITKTLNLGDVVKDVEDLNRIIAKKNIEWKDFEKVLHTKEKLIKILIASLNSQYAIPLNELLREITNLFNHKLDEKFAEEHNIDIEKLKKSKSIPWERKMFHWAFEFPEVFFGDKDGFNVIIGNPPYGRLKQIIEDKEEKYFFSKVYSSFYNYQVGNLNLYKLFLERSYYLLSKGGYFSMIFPSSFLGENDSKELRKLFFDSAKIMKILEFPERTRVFEGNTQAVCILFYRKDQVKDYNVEIKTNISRDGKNNLTLLDFLSLKKTELKKLIGKDYRIPLFSNPKIEWEILKYISKYPPFKGDDKNLPVGEIGVGHIDETFDKEFMRDEPADDLLIKGIHLDRYFVNLDPNGPKPRWIKDKKRFFDKKPESKKIAEKNKIVGRNTINKASKPRLRFAPLSKGYVITNNIKFIILSQDKIKLEYLISVLNSTLLNWRFELFSLQNRVNNYEIESLPVPRIFLNEQKPFMILAKYMLFLKQYQNYFAKNDKHLQYIIDYFDNLIDCLVYELYLGDVVKIPIKQFMGEELVDIEVPDNLLETPDKERKETYNKIHRVFEKLESNKKLNENLYLIKLHPWIKAIYESLGR